MAAGIVPSPLVMPNPWRTIPRAGTTPSMSMPTTRSTPMFISMAMSKATCRATREAEMTRGNAHGGNDTLSATDYGINGGGDALSGDATGAMTDNAVGGNDN